MNPITGAGYPTHNTPVLHDVLVRGGVKYGEGTSTDNENGFSGVTRQCGVGKYNMTQEQMSYEICMLKNKWKDVLTVEDFEGPMWRQAGKLQKALLRGGFWDCDLTQHFITKHEQKKNGCPEPKTKIAATKVLKRLMPNATSSPRAPLTPALLQGRHATLTESREAAAVAVAQEAGDGERQLDRSCCTPTHRDIFFFRFGHS